MIVVESIGLKNELDKYSSYIWKQNAPFSVFNEKDKWKKDVVKDSRLCFIYDVSSYDEVNLVKDLKTNFDDILGTLTIFILLIVEKPIEKELKSAMFPLFLCSETKRKLGKNKVHLRFQKNEFLFQILSILIIISTADQNVLNIFQPNETFTFLSSGSLFPESKLVSYNLIEGIEASLGGDSTDLSGIGQIFSDSENELRIEFNKDFFCSIAKNFNSIELKNNWKINEKFFSKYYLKNFLNKEKNAWKDKIRKFVTSNCDSINQAIESLNFYLNYCYSIPALEKVMFDYETPFQQSTLEVEKQVDDFEQTEWARLIKKKSKFILYSIAIALASCGILYFYFRLWLLGIVAVTLLLVWILGWKIPFSNYRSKYRELCSNIKTLLKKSLEIYRNSNLGWLKGHFSGYLDYEKDEYIKLKEHFENEAKDLEIVEIIFPNEWMEIKNVQFNKFKFSLKTILTKEFDLKAELVNIEQGLIDKITRLSGYYGLSLGGIQKYFQESFKEFHLSGNIPRVYADALILKINKRTTKTVLLVGENHIINQLNFPTNTVNQFVNINEKRGVFALTLEIVRYNS